MTLVHDASELDGALETAFRYDTLALAETYAPGARDLEVAVIGNGPADLELYGPGEIVSGREFYDYAAKYTAGLSETSTRAEVSDRERAAMHKIARDAYRAIGGEGFARVDFLLAGETILPFRDQHDPGLHADQPLPDHAGRGRLCLRGRVRPDRRARARAPRRARGPASDAGGPASMSRTTHRASHADAGRRPPGADRVQRASAGLSPVRAGAALAMLVCAAAVYGVGASSAFDYRKLRSRASASPTVPRSRPPSPSARGQNLFQLSTEPLEATLESLPTVQAAHRVRATARHARGHDRGARAGPHLAGRRSNRHLADAEGRLFAPLPTSRRPMRRDCRSSTTAVVRRRGCRSGSASTPSISMRPPGSPRSCRTTWAARRSRWPSS